MYTAVSLFCGAGGLDMGFAHEGFETLWANDFLHDACETFKKWSPDTEVVEGDVGKVDFDRVPESDIIIGGFPCQGFSAAGPRKLDDSRNTLYRYFVKLVNLKRPKVFVAENVKGLLSMGGGDVIKAIVNDFSDKGYEVTYDLVNAADYGVPQDRMRVIIVGIRKDFYSREFILPEGSKKHVTLREALSEISAPKDDEVCWAPFSSRFMSRNRKRGWEEVSYTIPAMAKQVTLHPSSPDMLKLGPDEWEFGVGGPTRRLSYKEAAAIQTFPEGMSFEGNLTSKYKQIGNAVPVHLAEYVAKAISDVLGDAHGESSKERESVRVCMPSSAL